MDRTDVSSEHVYQELEPFERSAAEYPAGPDRLYEDDFGGLAAGGTLHSSGHDS